MDELETTAKISIEQEMKKSYLEYAMSVIIGRALPDVRDGLKPVHRRVLFAMRELRNDWNKPYKKSARIVGDVIGKYHPHGDTAVYDTIVRMAQDFSLRYTLVDGQGNFGSVDGDNAAAMRYTEARMRKLSHQMLEDLDKDTVDWVPNYDESMSEPSVLPSKVPNLLINGSSGIAVGMTTNIPPHNLTEVVDGLIALIDDPELSCNDLMEYIPGPDFPTRGIIYGRSGIVQAYNTGRGIIKVRARVEVEVERKSGAETIVVHELPYQINKARLVENIAGLVRSKTLNGIRYVRDESDRDGMRIAIGLKRDQMPEVVINQLFKHTSMQSSFGIIFLAIVNNRPLLLNIKEILEHFIIHRKDIIIRRTLYDLNKAEEKAHILEGYKIALDNIDEIVALIRASKSPLEAKEGLMARFELSPIQAQAILDMRLQRLTGLERDKILEDLKTVLKDISWFREILASEKIVLGLIKDELLEMKENFGDERRTEIMGATKDISIEDLIKVEDMVVTVSKTGYIKRTPVTTYETQKRGGKGKIAMSTKMDDFPEHLFVASTHHTFMFFTNLGKVYWLKVYELPEAGRTSRGRAIVNLLNLEKDEKLATVLAVSEYEENKYIIKATKNGLVKKTSLMAYSRPRQGGIKAIHLNEGDELISTRITDGDMNIFLGSAMGKSIRFKESDVRATGRVARGVRGLRLGKGDRIVTMEVLDHGDTLLTATENGFGKRTSIDEFHAQKRGGKGVIAIQTTKRNGLVVAFLLVDNEDELMLMTDAGKLIRVSADSMSIIGRNTKGVKLINLAESEKLIGVARLPEQKEEEILLDDSGEPVSEDEPGSDVEPVSDAEPGDTEDTTSEDPEESADGPEGDDTES